MIVSVKQITVNQLWYSREGDGVPHRVIGFKQIGLGEWDVDVFFEWHDSQGIRREYSKNAYVFQVNYFCPEFEQTAASLDRTQRQSVWSK